MILIKVLGIGSPFGDDQVGWKVAEALTRQLWMYAKISQYVSIETHDRPGVRLLELMKGASTIFIIDAVTSDSKPGTIHRLKNKEIFESEYGFSTHNIGISQTLQLGNALNTLPETIIVYGIEMNTLEFQADLTPSVEAAIEQAATLLKNDILGMLPEEALTLNRV